MAERRESPDQTGSETSSDQVREKITAGIPIADIANLRTPTPQDATSDSEYLYMAESPRAKRRALQKRRLHPDKDMHSSTACRRQSVTLPRAASRVQATDGAHESSEDSSSASSPHTTCRERGGTVTTREPEQYVSSAQRPDEQLFKTHTNSTAPSSSFEAPHESGGGHILGIASTSRSRTTFASPTKTPIEYDSDGAPILDALVPLQRDIGPTGEYIGRGPQAERVEGAWEYARLYLNDSDEESEKSSPK